VTLRLCANAPAQVLTELPSDLEMARTLSHLLTIYLNTPGQRDKALELAAMFDPKDPEGWLDEIVARSAARIAAKAAEKADDYERRYGSGGVHGGSSILKLGLCDRR